jgi:hypothetical protein
MMIEVKNRVCCILITVLAVADCLFLGTLFTQKGKLPIFGALFPIMVILDKILVAVNTGVLNKLPAIFTFCWFFKAHDLEEICIKSEGFLAASKVAFEYLLFPFHHFFAYVAC